MSIKKINIERAIGLRKEGTLVFDVRTPGEFEKGHLPDAINLPLFSNEERVVVGTAYKKKGRHPAILLGLDIIGPKMKAIVERVHELCGHPKEAKPFVIHCWRGGMRSNAVGWLLELYGFQVSLIEGGYKSFRNWVLEEFEKEMKLLVIGGHTGAAKTQILGDLRARGRFVIDLEGLANHRGSAFGALGLPIQPTQQQFENQLAFELSEHGNAPIWIEDEARAVGRVRVPQTLFDLIRSSPVIFIKKSVEKRLDWLLKVYGDADQEGLLDSFRRIEKRLGSEQRRIAGELLEKGDIRSAARIALAYYDKSYEYGLSKRDQDKVYYLEIDDGLDDIEVVTQVIKFSEEIE